MRHKKRLRLLIIFALCVVFLFSAGMLIQYAVQSKAEQKAFAKLAETVDWHAVEEQRRSSQTPSLEANESDENYVSPYLPLKEQNADFLGWLSIDGTTIDYPVMHTPDDPEYYLRRSFDKTSARSGVPFLDASCFSGCGNYLIYGHNMNNGTMFAALLSYAREDFWLDHPCIQFDTLDSCGTYDVIAAFYTEIDPEEEAAFRYYQYIDLRDAEDFAAYIEQVKTAALYDTGVTPKYGDQLLTLSTCSYHTENGRFVVVARKATC